MREQPKPKAPVQVESEFTTWCLCSLTWGELAQWAVRKSNFWFPSNVHLFDFPRIYVKDSSCSLGIQNYFLRIGVSNITIPISTCPWRTYSSPWAFEVLTEGILDILFLIYSKTIFNRGSSSRVKKIAEGLSLPRWDSLSQHHLMCVLQKTRPVKYLITKRLMGTYKLQVSQCTDLVIQENITFPYFLWIDLIITLIFHFSRSMGNFTLDVLRVPSSSSKWSCQDFVVLQSA